MKLDSTRSDIPFFEFVSLMAGMMALVAVAIDAMLPALGEIGGDLGATHENHAQLVISMLFLGLGLGQIVIGPLSDSIGRRPAIFLGFILFAVGCVVSGAATDLTTMLAGRLLQGVGLAGPRIVSVAVVRDCFGGRNMARVMSFVMTVFILAPAVAPTLGQAILLVADWRTIFWTFLAMAAILSIWFGLRQRETLSPERRSPLNPGGVWRALCRVLRNRVVLGATVATGLVSATFLGLLSSIQQIFQDQYGLGLLFSLYFAALALSVGTASLLNGKLVIRLGMRFLSRRALLVYSSASIGYFLLAFWLSGHPPFWSLMAYLMLIMFCFGFVFGNLNAIAMEPLADIAGLGAAAIGSISTLISVPLGILIGQSYDGTVMPLVGGFAISGMLAIAVLQLADREPDSRSGEPLLAGEGDG